MTLSHPKRTPRITRPSIRKWLTTTLAIGAVVSSFSTAATAGYTDNLDSTTDAAIQRWSDLCAGLPTVRERVGDVTADDILRGLLVLQDAGLSDNLSRIYQDEACLSMAASAALDTPIVSLIRHPDPTDTKQIGNAVAAMPTHYKRIHTSRRLARLGVSLAPMGAALQQTSALDTEVALETANLGMLTQAGDVSRSYAVNTGQVCVLAIEPSPMLDHLKTHTPWTHSQLTDSTKDYLEQHAAAIEFWHEAAHCNHNRAAQMLNRTEPSYRVGRAFDSSSNQCHSPTHTAKPEGLFSSETQRSSIVQLIETDRSIQRSSENAFNDQINRRVRLSLLHESLADQFALRMLQERRADESCASNLYTTGHWMAMRILWSVENPDARYMTWLAPWLSGHPESVQHQVVLEAFHGALGAAKESLNPIAYRELIQRRGRPEFLTINDPQGTPDSARKDAWSNWLLNQARMVSNNTSPLSNAVMD